MVAKASGYLLARRSERDEDVHHLMGLGVAGHAQRAHVAPAIAIRMAMREIVMSFLGGAHSTPLANGVGIQK